MPQRLDEETVRHIARLARLEVNDAEVHDYALQLSAILDYVAALNEVNTDDVPSAAHVAPVANVFREDRPAEPWNAERALANAPDRAEQFFRVPKVLDQEGA